jgi:excisionase family DNA binding protein
MRPEVATGVDHSPRTAKASTLSDLMVMVATLLTLQEVVDILRVKESWIYGKIHDGSLPFSYCKIGRHLRFSSKSILEFVEKQTRGAA